MLERRRVSVYRNATPSLEKSSTLLVTSIGTRPPDSSNERSVAIACGGDKHVTCSVLTKSAGTVVILKRQRT